MKVEKCPECESSWLSDCWQPERKLRQCCNECSWIGETRNPEPRILDSVRVLNVSQFGGWTYEIFDRFNYILVISRTYHSEEEAKVAMVEDFKRNNKGNVAPLTAILWLDVVVVEGKVFTAEDLTSL